MRHQFASDPVTEVAQEDARAFAARELECRDEIAVSGHSHNGLHRLGQRKSRNVQSDAEINAFLLDRWHEILRLDQARSAHQAAKRAWADLRPCCRRLAKAKGKMRGGFESIQ